MVYVVYVVTSGYVSDIPLLIKSFVNDPMYNILFTGYTALIISATVCIDFNLNPLIIRLVKNDPGLVDLKLNAVKAKFDRFVFYYYRS